MLTNFHQLPSSIETIWHPNCKKLIFDHIVLVKSNFNLPIVMISLSWFIHAEKIIYFSAINIIVFSTCAKVCASYSHRKSNWDVECYQRTEKSERKSHLLGKFTQTNLLSGSPDTVCQSRNPRSWDFSSKNVFSTRESKMAHPRSTHETSRFVNVVVSRGRHTNLADGIDVRRRWNPFWIVRRRNVFAPFSWRRHTRRTTHFKFARRTLDREKWYTRR